MKLDDIDGVGPTTKESLKDVGISTIDDLASSSVEDITEAGISENRANDFKYKAKQNTIEIQTGNEVQEENLSRESVSSGVGKLDQYTNGGFSEGNIVALYGSDGSGKTQLCFNTVVSAVQEQDKPAIWIETERNRFSPDRVASIAGTEDVLDDIYRVKAYDLDTQLSSYKKIATEFNDVGIVIIDSLTARFRLSQKFQDRSNLSGRSNELGKHLSTIEKMVEKLQCPCILTAQVYQAPTQYESGDKLWGGSLLKHSIMYRVYMKETTGDVHEVTVEQHPSTGDNSFMISIEDDGIKEQ